MLFKLAWRNIFRNKRRTLITGIAIGIGLASLMFVDGLFIGMEENMVHSATASFIGDAQIHDEGFRETYDVEKTVKRLDETVARLEGESIVETYTLRTLSFAMISSPSNVDAVSLIGVDPSTEPALSQVDEALIEGTYFEGGSGRDVIIGSELADFLEVGIGDRVVLTGAEAHSGDLAQEMFRVSGIYKFHVKELDRAMAFVRLTQAQNMLGLDGAIHQIAIKFTDVEYGRRRDLPFWATYSKSGNEAVGWGTLVPQMEAMFALSAFSKVLVALILFSVVALGIMNTLFMSIHERMFEFGILRAVGTRGGVVAGLVVLEAGALAVVSIGLGLVLGLALNLLVGWIGIDYTGIEFAGVTFRERLYPVTTVQQFIIYPLFVFLFTTLIGLYPARYASRLLPARALRKSF